MPRRPRSPSPATKLVMAAPETTGRRSYLFIFIILWFSSLQIVLFTWNQLPSTVIPVGGFIAPMTPHIHRRRLADSTYTECSRFQEEHKLQLCGILSQIWEAIPEPNDLANDVERRIYPNAIVRESLSTNGTVTTDTVVLATHLGVQKLEILRIQATWWSGPVSASVHMSHREDIVVFLDFLQTHAEELRYVSFHIVLEKTNLPYPHNILRNLALEYLDADFFVATDVDFIPNFGAYRGLDSLLHDDKSKVRQCLVDRGLFVLPAFERFMPKDGREVTEDMLPKTKADLQAQFKEKSVIGFHMGGSPLGHGPTNFQKFLRNNTEAFYDIEYKNVFEPYVMGYRPGIPRFWEEFRGYGYNKFSWYMELHRACYEFYALRDFYLVHMNHVMVRRTAKKEQTDANRESWREFKAYLSKRYQQTCLGHVNHSPAR